jgi:hypothetical protein
MTLKCGHISFHFLSSLTSVFEGAIDSWFKEFHLDFWKLCVMCSQNQFFENTDWWVKVHKQAEQIIGKQIWGGVKSTNSWFRFYSRLFHSPLYCANTIALSKASEKILSYHCVHNWFDLPRVSVWKLRREAFYGLKYWLSE